MASVYRVSAHRYRQCHAQMSDLVATEAFLTALNTHKGILYKVSNAYCVQRDARGDLVQEIILELWRAYPNFNGARAKFSTWMYRIALNVAISLHRAQTRRVEGMPALGPALSTDLLDFAAADLAIANENNDALTALHQLLAAQDPLSRALVLLYLEGYEQNEIAELTGLTPSNVSTRLQRIKQKMRDGANPESTK
jgi:RNA polymerase sigma factor (sigma-70 family)